MNFFASISLVLDPVEPDTFWINPYGVHFGLLTVSDMVRVDAHGNRVGGADKLVNTAGFIIHSAIHHRRPDIHAACQQPQSQNQGHKGN